MKRIMTSLLFAAALLAVATVSHAPAATYQEPTLQAQCCGDPDPVCPPVCGSDIGANASRSLAR